jgi:hypothetical protein
VGNGNLRTNLHDLEKLSRVPGISILEFFPKVSRENDRGQKVDALMRAAEGLQESDLDELRSWAEFRRARQTYESRKRGQRSHQPMSRSECYGWLKELARTTHARFSLIRREYFDLIFTSFIALKPSESICGPTN